jgi:hypothetical protein
MGLAADGSVPAAWFRGDCSPGEGEVKIKNALAENPAQIMNMYTCEPAGGILGMDLHMSTSQPNLSCF